MNTPIKERYFLIEYEERDPNSPGWNYDDTDKYLSVSQAIEEAEKLAENEGDFYKAFRVVEVCTETKITVIKEFRTVESFAQVEVSRPRDKVLIEALQVLVDNIDSLDGVANAVIAESAIRLLDLTRGIKEVLEDNRHLADGDDCTLIKLKKLLPEWK
jgi:hypothetical protein